MPERALMIYDGDCSFCRRWIARWRRLTRDRVEYRPFQEAAASFPDIPPAQFAETVHLREPDGRWSRGAEAVFRSLRGVPVLGVAAWAYTRVPGFAALSERLYRWVAANRGRG